MTDDEFKKINEERKKKGLLPLSRSDAVQAKSEGLEKHGSDWNWMHFLIGYNLGVPMPSQAGLVGFAMSPTHYTEPTPTPAPSYEAPSSPAYEPPAPTPSYDPSPSPSFSDMGSSAISSGVSGGTE